MDPLNIALTFTVLVLIAAFIISLVFSIIAFFKLDEIELANAFFGCAGLAFFVLLFLVCVMYSVPYLIPYLIRIATKC